MSFDSLATGWSKPLVVDRKQYNMFFERMLDGFAYHKIVVDKAGKPIDYVFLEVNPAFEKLTGLKREKLLGKRVTEVLPGIENDPADWIGLYGRVAISGEPVQFENYAKPLDKWYSISAYCPEKGCFVALFEDITQRKKMEEALRESEQRWETTISSIGDAVITTDLDGNITFLNSVAESLTGWGLAEASCQPLRRVFNILNEQSRKEVENPVTRVLKEGNVVGLANHTILINKDGSEIPIDDSGAPIRDKNGNVTGVVLVFRDITEQKKLEKELYSLAKFPSENPYAVFRVDKNGVVLFANPESQQLPEPFRLKTGQHVFESWHKHVVEALVASKGLDFEADTDGRVFLFKVAPIRSEGYANIYGIEITDQKKAEGVLIEYSSIVNSASDAIFSTNSDLIFKSWNNAAERMFGWKAEEVIGKASTSMLEAVYPTLDGTTREQALAELMDSGFWKGEIDYHKKDGSLIPVLVSASLMKDHKGSISGIVAVIHDMTLRKKREVALRQIQHDLNHAQAVAKTGSWRLDTQRNILLWSKENHRIFGAPRGMAMTYETFLSIVHPDDRGYVDRKWKAGLKGEHYDIEHRIIVDGKVKWVRERAELEFDKDGTLLGGFGTTQEITDIVEMREKLLFYSKHLEELVEEKTKLLRDTERLATIGQTAGMVGHDIRNPLQSITGDIYLAKADVAMLPKSEEKASLLESLTAIENSVEYINKIVADLQDFAKPLNPCDEETYLEVVVNDLLVKNGLPKIIKPKVRIGKDAAKVMTDSAFIKRIIGNLITNAVQAMPKGGTLSIEAFRDLSDIVIMVEDTGVGISESVKSRMFTPLFTTKSKGQGFGLAVVKRMTEALGGTVTYESEIGKGTKFIVRLPRKVNVKL